MAYTYVSRPDLASDAELLRRSRRDPDAFVTLCDRHTSSLRAWLRAETRNDWHAEDLLAETLAEAWYSRRRYRDPGSGSAGAWLFGIARNLVRRYRREGVIAERARRKLHLPTPAPPDDSYAEADARLDAKAELDGLKDGLADLPPEQREALALHVVGELPFGEVAERLSVPETTARTRTFRALRKLRTAARRTT